MTTDAQKIEKKMEDKSVEGAKADLSAEKGNPGVEDNTPSNKATVSTEIGKKEDEKPSEGAVGTFQRKDGTISSVDHPDRTATYVGGTRVMLTKAEKDSYTKLNEDLNKLQNGRGISDIPLVDPFWQKKSELDQFITNLRR